MHLGVIRHHAVCPSRNIAEISLFKSVNEAKMQIQIRAVNETNTVKIKERNVDGMQMQWTFGALREVPLTSIIID